MLSWYESHAEDEVPPENIWEDTQGLEQWWEEVEAKRKALAEDPSAASGQDDEDDPRMLSNELTRELRN